MKQEFLQKYGPWALVTGAAQGLGSAFAEQLAERGLNVVLVDRQHSVLASTAFKLKEKYNVDFREVVIDLEHPNFIEKLTSETNDLEIGLLVANAAVGYVGSFAEIELETMLSGIDVNVKAALILSHTFCKAMISRKKGGIIFLASSSGYLGTPYVANYCATKAYNLILAEALWYELGKYDVDVLGFSPGATNTPSFRGSRGDLKEGEKSKGVLLPDLVADRALQVLGQAPSARPGFWATLETFVMTRLLKRGYVIKRAGDYIGGNFS